MIIMSSKGQSVHNRQVAVISLAYMQVHNTYTCVASCMYTHTQQVLNYFMHVLGYRRIKEGMVNILVRSLHIITCMYLLILRV